VWQLGREPSCINIQGVQEYFITGLEHWGKNMILIVVLDYVVLRFLDSRLGFLQHRSYSLHESWDILWLGLLLVWFEAHLQKPVGIKEKEWLLYWKVYIVVVLEFCYQKQVVPVALLLIHKCLEILIKLLVYLLCLSIQLWVLGHWRDNFNSEKMV